MTAKAFTASILSAVVAGVILWMIIPSDGGGDPVISGTPAPVVHQQETTFARFATPLDQDHPYTRVFGYLDFDAGSGNRGDADVMVTAHFFADPAKPNEIRALNSALRTSTDDSTCRGLSTDPDGSSNTAIRTGQSYCLMTNQGRPANIQITQILGSWGANAEIEVRYSYTTYERP